jgi:hypothetical protein
MDCEFFSDKKNFISYEKLIRCKNLFQQKSHTLFVFCSYADIFNNNRLYEKAVKN